MSGGYFDYQQYKIDQIADQIEDYIYKCEKRLEKDYTYNNESVFYEESEEILDKMREGVKMLKTAAVYAQRIDWYLSGDDGPETFLERLQEELSELKK